MKGEGERGGRGERGGVSAASEGLWDRVENDKLQPLGDGPNGKQLLLAQPLQMTYDVDEGAEVPCFADTKVPMLTYADVC